MRTAIATTTLALMLGVSAYAQQAPLEIKEADAMLSIDTQTFTRQVASSNAFEIESSRVALEKLSDGPLKAFAEQMIADHTKAGEEFKAALEQAGQAAPPLELAPKHAAMLELLKAAEGGDVAMLYTDMQFGAHKEAVALFMTFAKTGDDPAVRQFATKTLPTLEMHLMHIRQMVETPAG